MAHKRKQTISLASHPTKNKQNGKEKERNGTNGCKEGVRWYSEMFGWQFWTTEKVLYCCFIFVCAMVSGYLHRNHIARMFERDTRFSYLSSLERELSFKTEQGFYYSYYKTIIQSPSFLSGLRDIVFDNVTEYPKTINTLKRFNLYPEVTLATGYRLFDSFTNLLNIETKECRRIRRGRGLPSIDSCFGLGDPHYFYVEGIFFLNGINMAVLFLFGVYLSGSVFGGALVVAAFFFNHNECTRVQWSPNLRENFAYPFLVMQMFLVTHTIKTQQPNYKHSIMIAIATACFMLPWQFAQFALLTQTMSVFAVYILQFIGSHRLKVIILGQTLGLCASYILLFGNEMLISSYFCAALVTCHVLVRLEPIVEKIKIRFLILLTQSVSLIGGIIAIKFVTSRILSVKDDAHVNDILKSKFSNYSSYHTKIYTCAKVFDFMDPKTLLIVSKTLLLPSVMIVILATIFHIMRKEFHEWRNGNSEDGQEKPEGNTTQKLHAELVYHVIQFSAFSIMALIIMRLKIFWTPHMCLMTSLLASEKLFGGLFKDFKKHTAAIVLVLAIMSYEGVRNLNQQWAVSGEFSDVPTEELVSWVNANTPKNAVFAGPMDVMATIKLTTQRPIVNHPHYEDADLRRRTKLVDTSYSRKPPEKLRKIMQGLQVEYLIMDHVVCFGKSTSGCTMQAIWDAEDKENLHRPSTCAELFQNSEPNFETVFRNRAYLILRVRKDY